MKAITYPIPLPSRMRYRVPHRATLCLALLASRAGWGQTTVPAPASARGEDESVVDLSPFVVRSDRDSGYQAATTLAGTRVNTPIKDLAAAISTRITSISTPR